MDEVGQLPDFFRCCHQPVYQQDAGTGGWVAQQVGAANIVRFGFARQIVSVVLIFEQLQLLRQQCFQLAFLFAHQAAPAASKAL